MWLKGRQNIPKKYLPVLEELVGIDQLETQKEKLKRDLKPVIKKHEQQYSLVEINDLAEIPI